MATEKRERWKEGNKLRDEGWKKGENFRSFVTLCNGIFCWPFQHSLSLSSLAFELSNEQNEPTDLHPRRLKLGHRVPSKSRREEKSKAPGSCRLFFRIRRFVPPRRKKDRNYRMFARVHLLSRFRARWCTSLITIRTFYDLARCWVNSALVLAILIVDSQGDAGYCEIFLQPFLHFITEKATTFIDVALLLALRKFQFVTDRDDEELCRIWFCPSDTKIYRGVTEIDSLSRNCAMNRISDPQNGKICKILCAIYS